jgi:hypothetical protein
MVPGALFTTLHFLNYLVIWPGKLVFVPGMQFKHSAMLHSSLLGPFASYEGKEVL